MPFRPPRNPYRSLSKSLDAKVLSLVRKYVADVPADQPILRINVAHIYTRISLDPSLLRQKKHIIEKAIDRALDILRNEAEDGGDARAVDADNSFDGLDSDRLTISTDVNTVNNKYIRMWQADGGTAIINDTTTLGVDKVGEMVVPEPGGVSGIVATPAGQPLIKKRKERRADREDGSKRQKGDRESRDPPQNVSLKDLGGMEEVANQLLEEIGMPLKHPEIYEYTGIAPPRGILLHGPPGCGKTMLANAFAGEMGLPFIAISAPSIVSGMSGESEKKLRELFEEARENAPCIIFIDEIDAIAPKRESVQREMERRIVAQMLTCMDEMTLEKLAGKPVVILAATNRPDSLDPALRRAGRFDREICLNVPDEEGREKILKVLCQKLRLSGDFNFKILAKMTPGFVGADLKSLASAAGTVATKRMLGTLAFMVASSRGELQSTDADGMAMDLDPAHSNQRVQSFSPLADSTIGAFLAAFPDRLTEVQLAPLAITNADFLTALPTIQPSSKREGFATVPDVTWADIGALHPIRSELQMAIVQPIAHPELFSLVGITAPTGVLLWGPPGCGKTLLAKAVANESRANFISVRGPELLNKFVGESERAVRQVFSRARASKPCVIFFDELDALVPRRDDALSESSSRVVNTLLTELDGLEDRRGVFVVGATNRPDVIDPAMVRPGRLDKTLFVDLPGPGERAEILKTLTKRTPLDRNVDLDAVANDHRALCYSGADLAALVREASTVALRKVCFREDGSVKLESAEDVRVGKTEFDQAFGKVRPSVSQDDRYAYKELAVRFGVQHLAK